MINVLELPMDEVIFSHIDDETGEQTHYAISHIEAWIKAAQPEIFIVPVEIEFATLCMEQRGIEQHRLTALYGVENPEPVIFIHLEDDTHLLIDGSHRYVHMARSGKQALRAYILEPEQWRPFLIAGIPKMAAEQVVGGYSGL